MRKIGFALLFAGCTSSGEHKLPSATITPHLASQATTVACGEDIAFVGPSARAASDEMGGADGGPRKRVAVVGNTPDISYVFGYDAKGMLVHADGVYAAGGANDAIDYTYDAAGELTHMLESRGFGDSRVEITADYDDAENLLEYNWEVTAPQYHDSWTYAFSSFAAPNQPTREDITEQGQPSFGYTLVWDADGRITQVVPDSGPTTTYTYDDVARTIAIDTSNGAWTDLVSYDAQDRELSEVWGGTDPSAIAGSDVLAWAGDQLQTLTYSSGTEQAPQTANVVEVDTLHYACANARAAAGRPIRFAQPGARRF